MEAVWRRPRLLEARFNGTKAFGGIAKVFNPGAAQTVFVDLSSPAGRPLWTRARRPVHEHERAAAGDRRGLSEMGAGEVRAYGLLPRHLRASRRQEGRLRGRTTATPARQRDDAEGAFLECLKDPECDNVYIEYAKIGWMAAVRYDVLLLGKVDGRASRASETGTLVKKLVDGRPAAAAAAAPREAPAACPRKPPSSASRDGGSSGWCRWPFGWAWSSRSGRSTPHFSHGVAHSHFGWSADAPDLRLDALLQASPR